VLHFQPSAAPRPNAAVAAHSWAAIPLIIVNTVFLSLFPDTPLPARLLSLALSPP
jgi:hypothetical protein